MRENYINFYRCKMSEYTVIINSHVFEVGFMIYRKNGEKVKIILRLSISFCCIQIS